MKTTPRKGKVRKPPCVVCRRGCVSDDWLCDECRHDYEERIEAMDDWTINDVIRWAALRALAWQREQGK